MYILYRYFLRITNNFFLSYILLLFTTFINYTDRVERFIQRVVKNAEKNRKNRPRKNTFLPLFSLSGKNSYIYRSNKFKFQ